MGKFLHGFGFDTLVKVDDQTEPKSEPEPGCT